MKRTRGAHLKGTGSPILPPNTVTVPAPIVCSRAPTALERDEVEAEVEVAAEVVKASLSPKEQQGTMRHPACRAARTISLSPPPCPPVLPATMPTLFFASRSDLNAPYTALYWPEGVEHPVNVTVSGDNQDGNLCGMSRHVMDCDDTTLSCTVR
jgi:hypothetical protein